MASRTTNSPLWPLTVLVLCTFCFFNVAAFPADREALLEFKQSVVDSRGELRGWLEDGSPPCDGRRSDWRGVFCDGNGNVIKLVLENLNLSGTLNTDPLLRIKALKSISLMNNNFEGAMPNVGAFVWLRSLYLSGNHLSGVIRDNAFIRMLALNRVHLARNNFTGPIPSSLVGILRLAELMIEKNNFEGRIPDFQQKGLKLNMSNNLLEGPIPDGLSKYDDSSFIGNKNLCGPPLAILCNGRIIEPPTSPFAPSLSSIRRKNFMLTITTIVLVIIVLLSLLVLFFFIFIKCRTPEERLGHPPSTKTKTSYLEAVRTEHPSSSQNGSANIGGKRGGRDTEHGKLIMVKEGKERFGMEDLLKASAEVLGSGNFGSSYKAVLPSGALTVVKRFREMNAVGREDFSEHMRRLARLSHPNLLPLVAYYYRKEEKLLVFDYIPKGSLAHMLHGGHGPGEPRLDWPSRLSIVKGVARGMNYLHNELPILNLPHGHLKSSNVLLDEKFRPLLTDYALTPVMNYDHASRIMVAYKAPEIVQHVQVTKKADVWSLGILILEILTGKFPAIYLLQGNDGTDMTTWVTSITEGNIESVFDRQMGETIRHGEIEMTKLLHIGKCCCEVDVEKRWDLTEALEKIEQLQDDAEEHSSCVTEAMTQDELSF